MNSKGTFIKSKDTSTKIFTRNKSTSNIQVTQQTSSTPWHICDFDKKEEYYKVKYQDGNTEEYDEEEIGTMLHKTKQNTNIMRALAATKHEQIIEQYTTMESIYTPPSQFSGRFSKAMTCVEMMALDAINKQFETVGLQHQDYKWANAVIEEETGDVMNLKKLMRHPKYTEM